MKSAFNVMNQNLFRAYLMVLFSALSVAAQSPKTVTERMAFTEKLAKSAAEGKRNAKAWAKARGLPMRMDNGFRVKELMAIHNGKPLYYKTLNAGAALSTATDQVRNTSPFNLNGAGITVGVWDAGSVLTTHQEFGSRVTVKDGTAFSDDHASHVGGTLGASGVQANAQGMAPSVSLDSYRWDSDLAEMSLAAATAPGQSSKLYLSNHSYGISVGWEDGNFEGHEEFGQYMNDTRLMDQIVANNPYYLPFVSAGNDRNDGPGDATNPADGVYKNGYDTISYYAIAKNVMAVGAVQDAVSGSSRSLAHATMSGFSSWGPADDGRIKPDLVANGVGLYSCDDDHNTDYASRSGTSMSSPNACGSAALLVEYYKELSAGGAMRASTLKGLILHTADDLGRPGPDYENGWGLMNTRAAAELLQASFSNPIRLTEATVTTGQQSDTHTFFSDGNEPVRVTLCWTDPPGPTISVHDNRTPDLVNNLNLKVMSAGGTLWPYKLDYNNPTDDATTTEENNVDNVEQVYIAAPGAGLYTVTVNFNGALSGGSQGYSLLISGPGSDSDGDGLPNAWENQYFGGPTNALPTAALDGDGANNLTEYISGYDPTDSTSVFTITDFTPPPTGDAPFILSWNPVAGRIYSIGWSDGLIFPPFSDISGELPFSVNRYTDSVERTSLQNFYQVDVRLEE